MLVFSNPAGWSGQVSKMNHTFGTLPPSSVFAARTFPISTLHTLILNPMTDQASLKKNNR